MRKEATEARWLIGLTDAAGRGIKMLAPYDEMKGILMSLNLTDRPPPSSSTYHISPAFNDAVNDAQFVRTFGIAALVCSIIALFWPAIATGVGLAVFGFGKTRYYRLLGLMVVIVSIVGILLAPLRVIGSVVLAAGVGWKGADILILLSSEGKGDPDWQTTKTRAIVGMIFCVAGIVVSAVWMLLFLIPLLLPQ